MSLIDNWDSLVSRLDVVTTEEEAFDEFNQVLAGHGGKHLQLGELGPILTTDTHCAGNFPEEWNVRYMEKNYWTNDPAFVGALKGGVPVSWGNIRRNVKDPDAAIIFEEAKDFGLADGWTIPIFQINGYKAAISVCAETFDDDPRLLPTLHMMAIYFHGKVLNIRQAPYLKPSPFHQDEHFEISPREVECLKWVAAGKTDGEIADILGIGNRTVHKHVESAKFKFGVPTRLQAVVSAVRQGIISLW